MKLKPEINVREATAGSENRFNDTYESILKRYKKRVLFFIQKKWLSMGLVVASIVLLMFFMNTTPTGMVPNEDTCDSRMQHLSDSFGVSVDHCCMSRFIGCLHTLLQWRNIFGTLSMTPLWLSRVYTPSWTRDTLPPVWLLSTQ